MENKKINKNIKLLFFITLTLIFVFFLNIETVNSFEITLFISHQPILYIIKLCLSFLTTYMLYHFLYNQFEKKFI
jgi:hypothetical protein